MAESGIDTNTTTSTRITLSDDVKIQEMIESDYIELSKNGDVFARIECPADKVRALRFEIIGSETDAPE